MSRLVFCLSKYSLTFCFPCLFIPVLAAAAICIHMLSWSSIAKWKQFSSINVSDHYGDIVSNIINCFFLLRVSFLQLSVGSPNRQEFVLFAFQTFGSILIMCHPYSVIYDPSFNTVLAWLLVVQLVSSWLVAIFHFLPNFKGYNLHALLVEANNTLMPVFMVYSFVLINVHFPWLLEELSQWDSVPISWIIFAYELAVVSAKSYCIYTYVNFQMQREAVSNEDDSFSSSFYYGVEEKLEPLPSCRLSIQSRMFLIVSGFLIVADTIYIGMYYVFSST